MARFVYDYGSLLVAVELWVSENSPKILTSFDMIVGIAENRIESDLNLELFDGVNESITVPASRTVLNKPDDWMVTRNIYISNGSGGWEPLYERPESFVTNINLAFLDGKPEFYYDINESQLLFGPTRLTEEMTFRMKYKRRSEGLNVSNGTTWISRNYPNLLLQACLIEAERILKITSASTNPSQDYAIALGAAARELGSLMDNEMVEDSNG